MKNYKADKIYHKYHHIGYSYPGVPGGWMPIVIQAIKDIEKAMWPQKWMPRFVKRWIYYLATGNSVVRVRSNFWYYKVLKPLTRGQGITDIKDKYATLRIYGYYNDAIDRIITQAEKDCENTCEWCGINNTYGPNEVEIVSINHWYYNLCKYCKKTYENGKK